VRVQSRKMGVDLGPEGTSFDVAKSIVGLPPSFSSHVRFGERGAPVDFLRHCYEMCRVVTYSDLRVCMGSMEAAWRAGPQEASTATRSMVAAAAANSAAPAAWMP
jgi:hypothetical protein